MENCCENLHDFHTFHPASAYDLAFKKLNTLLQKPGCSLVVTETMCYVQQPCGDFLSLLEDGGGFGGVGTHWLGNRNMTNVALIVL